MYKKKIFPNRLRILLNWDKFNNAFILNFIFTVNTYKILYLHTYVLSHF